MNGTLLIGIVALLYGIATLVLRQTRPQTFLKLGIMRKRFGDRTGTLIHTLAYSILPIYIGVSLIGQEVDITELAGEKSPEIYVSAYVPVEFTFPHGWYKNPGEHPYDLQTFAPGQKITAGFFLFKEDDFDPETTPKDVLVMQVEDLKSKRDSFLIAEPPSFTRTPSLSLEHRNYHGEKDGNRYHYRFTLIEFQKDPNTYAIVLQVTFPERWEKDKHVLDGILKSATLLTQE